MTSRKCKNCGVVKPLNVAHFQKTENTFKHECKECVRDRENRQRREQYASANPDRLCPQCGQHKHRDTFPKKSGVQACFACRDNPPAERTCSICKETKPVEEFEKGQKRRQCKECRKALHQERISQRVGIEWECNECHQVKPACDFYEGRRVCKGCISESTRHRRIEDYDWTEKVKRRKRADYAKNPEPVRIRSREKWAQTFRECVLCGEKRTQDGFVWDRQICKQCFNAPSVKCKSCGKNKPKDDFPPEMRSFLCRDGRNAQTYQWRAKIHTGKRPYGKRVVQLLNIVRKQTCDTRRCTPMPQNFRRKPMNEIIFGNMARQLLNAKQDNSSKVEGAPFANKKRNWSRTTTILPVWFESFYVRIVIWELGALLRMQPHY